MGINRVLRISVVLIMLGSAVSAGAQTISLKDHRLFFLKFARTDTLKPNNFDLTRLIDWQLDTTGKVDDLKLMKEIDWNKRFQPFVWMASDQFTYGPWGAPSTRLQSQPNGLVMPDAKLAFFILGNAYNTSSECDVVTVWDLIGADSIRFRCATLTGYSWFNDEIHIVKGVKFPDSSFLLYLNVSSVSNDGDEGGNWFYQIKSPCDVRLLYKSLFWCVDISSPRRSISIDSDNLDNQHFRVCERKDYGKTVAPWMRNMTIDSEKVRFIDLWDIAQGRSPVDTAGRVNCW